MNEEELAIQIWSGRGYALADFGVIQPAPDEGEAVSS